MLAIAILAAGKGTRMKSSLPKVLQELCGTTLVERVIRSCKGINPDRSFVIVGHEAHLIKTQINHISGLEFVYQQPQNGTGHAVQQLTPYLNTFRGDLLVLNGDVPFIKVETIKNLLLEHRSAKADVSLLSARIKNPKGYGRIICDSQGHITKIIEDRDCNKKELENNLTNAGIYCFKWEKLLEILPSLSNNNEQHETYLTDTIEQLNKAIHVEVSNSNEVIGINDKQQLAYCENLLQEELRTYWMQEGVKFINPMSCTLSEQCTFGKDVVIEPETHIRGKTRIGNNCHLGPNSYIEASSIDDNVKITYSVVKNSCIASNVEIGPFSYLRPQTEVGTNCKIGNFVEVKNSKLGNHTKVNHLSYIGDSLIGEKVNIGAGTITANFDGLRKHKTIIGSQSKTGANSVLVAPIRIGENTTIGAGSTITENVPNMALAIARSKQYIKADWSKNNIKSKDQ